MPMSKYLEITAVNPAVDLDKIKEEYNDVLARNYDREYIHGQGGYLEYSVEIFQQLLSSSSAVKILDAGCGTGLFGSLLQQAGYINIIGCDLSQSMLNVAKEKDAYQKLVRTNLLKPLPFSEQEFDAVSCIATFTHIQNAEPVLNELCRITKDGCIILFTHRNDLYEKWNCKHLYDHLEKKKRWKKEFQSEWRLYIPNHQAYADKIKFACFVYRVCSTSKTSALAL